MRLHDPLNPYAGNILVDVLGEIPAPQTALSALMYLPTPPRSMDDIPKHIRAHHLMSVSDFHLPTVEEHRLLTTTDLMIRQGYRYRDPRLASTWGLLSGEAPRRNVVIPPALAASVEGVSGVGKTQACLRCLNTLPKQLVRHDEFPRLQNGLTQVTWLSVEVPASGKAADFASALMFAWKQATGSSRFDAWLNKDKIVNALQALDEWKQEASIHFLGLLHIDEIQNLFKLVSLKQRKDRKGLAAVPELSIVEDQLLRWILNLLNTGKIPVFFSGTPDGIGALTRRLSTSSRIASCGYHPFEPFSHADAPDYKLFLQHLGKYQYVRHRIAIDDSLAKLIINLTGGIQRIIIALWIAAHRVAFERASDELTLKDFVTAAQTWLAPLTPAIAALQSKDPNRMARYEDLVPRDTAFWSNFWRGATSSTS